MSMRLMRNNLALVSWLMTLLVFVGTASARATWQCLDGRLCPPGMHDHAGQPEKINAERPPFPAQAHGQGDHDCCAQQPRSDRQTSDQTDPGLKAAAPTHSDCVLRSAPPSEAQISAPVPISLDLHAVLPGTIAPQVFLNSRDLPPVPWSRPPPGRAASCPGTATTTAPR